MELKPQQLEGVEAMGKWLASDEPAFILSGYPGTGKTFSTKYVARHFPHEVFLFTAPTNKATQALTVALEGEFKTMTTYSALGLRLDNTSEVRGLAQNSIAAKVLKKVSVLVVDEASFIDASKTPDKPHTWRLLDYILEAADIYQFKILFLGDPLQLPPPSSDDAESPVFKQGFPEYTLTEVVRHSGKILDYVKEMRRQLTATRPIFPAPEKWGIEYITDYRGSDLKNDLADFISGDLKLIAWRNKVVDKANNSIRAMHFGANCGAIMPEDKIMFTQPVMDISFFENFDSPLDDPKAWVNNKKFQIIASIDQQAEVLSVEEVYLWGLQLYRVSMKVEGNKNMTAFFLNPKSAIDHKRMVDKLASNAKRVNDKRAAWQVFHHFKEAITPIKFSYAFTAHRAQGSTFKRVLLEAGDIMSNRDRNVAYRCAYVGMSRPKEELRILWRAA